MYLANFPKIYFSFQLGKVAQLEPTSTEERSLKKQIFSELFLSLLQEDVSLEIPRDIFDKILSTLDTFFDLRLLALIHHICDDMILSEKESLQAVEMLKNDSEVDEVNRLFAASLILSDKLLCLNLKNKINQAIGKLIMHSTGLLVKNDAPVLSKHLSALLILVR